MPFKICKACGKVFRGRAAAASVRRHAMRKYSSVSRRINAFGRSKAKSPPCVELASSGPTKVDAAVVYEDISESSEESGDRLMQWLRESHKPELLFEDIINLDAEATAGNGFPGLSASDLECVLSLAFERVWKVSEAQFVEQVGKVLPSCPTWVSQVIFRVFNTSLSGDQRKESEALDGDVIILD